MSASFKNPASYGATREAWRSMPSRVLLQSVLDEHPEASRDEQCRLYVERVRENVALQDEAARRMFDNDYRLLTKMPPKLQGIASSEAAATTARLISKLLTLDFIMPDGKPLRDATGASVKVMGGIFAEIGERVGHNQRVGDVLTDADLLLMVGSR